jgi:hypothetical protein
MSDQAYTGLPAGKPERLHRLPLKNLVITDVAVKVSDPPTHSLPEVVHNALNADKEGLGNCCNSTPFLIPKSFQRIVYNLR